MESECRIFIKNFNFTKENSMLNFNEKIKLWKGILIVNFYELLQPRFSQQCSKSVVYHINFDLYQICVWVSKIIFFFKFVINNYSEMIHFRSKFHGVQFKIHFNRLYNDYFKKWCDKILCLQKMDRQIRRTSRWRSSLEFAKIQWRWSMI